MPSHAITNTPAPPWPPHPVASRFIREGDLVILFLSRDKTPVPIRVTPGHHYNNLFGTFSHAHMIGRPFGSCMRSHNARGFLHLLRPTPELWTTSLPHRTQIVYHADIALVLLKLRVGPGARVIEAGTGSGSFTHSLARCVARASQWNGGRGWKGDGAEREQRDARDGGTGRQPSQAARRESQQRRGDDDEEEQRRRLLDVEAKDAVLSQPSDPDVPETDGRVWSFEFNELRAKRARSEFEAHNLDRVVSLRHRNVCKSGFGLRSVADAVFLDLPSPWEALPHCVESLRADVATRVCCFSPCVEQVLRTAESLRRSGFCDVETYESLVRHHEVVGQPWAAPLRDVGEAVRRVRRVEENKARRREAQIVRARIAREAAGGGGGGGGGVGGQSAAAASTLAAVKSERGRAGRGGDHGDGEGGVVDHDNDNDDGEGEGEGEGDDDAALEYGKSNKRRRTNGDAGSPKGVGGRVEESGGDDVAAEQTADARATTAGPDGRRGREQRRVAKDDADGHGIAEEGESDGGGGDEDEEVEVHILQGGRSARGGPPRTKVLRRANVYSRPFSEMRGHTSYLTFATLLPRQIATTSNAVADPNGAEGGRGFDEDGDDEEGDDDGGAGAGREGRMETE